MKKLIVLFLSLHISYFGFSQTPLISVSTNDETSICKEKSIPTILTANLGSYLGSTQFLNGDFPKSDTHTCDCPPGYIAVGYQVRAGNWMDAIRLVCKKLNPDGTLDPAVVTTSWAGGGGGSDVGTATFDNNTAMTGANLQKLLYQYPGFTTDITGYGQPISDVIAGKDNSVAPEKIATLGSGVYYPSGQDAGTVFSPPGTVITGMAVTVGPASWGGTFVGGISFKYSSINELLKKYTVTWSGGQTGSSIAVLPTETTTYTATVTNDAGLSASASQTITIVPNQLTAPEITESGVYHCAGGGNVTLFVPNDYTSYQWSTGATTSSALISQSGSYNITVVAKNGCSATASKTIELIDVPNSTDIYVDSSINKSGEGVSWSTAFKTLTEAISAANGCATIKNIWVAKGTYTPTAGNNRDSAFALFKGGVKIYGGYPSGGGIRNIAVNPTVLSGNIGAANDNSDNSYHVLVIAGLPADADSLVLDGLTIADGRANGNSMHMYGSVDTYQGTGGGAHIMNNANKGKIALRNLIITNNQAGYVAGGFEISNSSPVIDNCIFSNNSGAHAGGGMSNEASSHPDVTNCLFVSNSSDRGGGVFNTSSYPVIANCTFNGNKSNTGGGIYNEYSSSTITNCIIWGNTGNDRSVYNSNGTLTVTYNLIQDGYDGTGNFKTDPLFVDTANGNLRLQPCSPVINAGDNASNSTDKDLDGNPRIANSTIDIGAYEFQGLAGPVSIIKTPQPVTVCSGQQAKFSVTATGGNLSYRWQRNEADINGATDSVYSMAVTASADAGRYRVIVSGCGSPVTSDAAQLIVNTAPPPVVTVTNNCGSSTLSTTATGSLLWSTGDITSGITVNKAGDYTVTQTINGCISDKGSATAAPGTPTTTPVVTVVNNCGSSTLSIPAGGTIAWSNGAITPTITVTSPGTYKVTRTLNGCRSAEGSGTAAPKAKPATPVVTVLNGCGATILTATATGKSLLWSTGATIPIIAVTEAGTYTVMQTVNGCSSAPGTGTAAPKAIPAKPAVSVTNNCGSSVLSTTATGSLLWSTGAKTPSVTVSTPGTYSAIQTANGCISLPGLATAAPNKALTITANNISVNTAINTSSASVALGSAVTVTGAPAPTVVYKTGSKVITSSYIFPVGATTVSVTATNSCGTVTKTFVVTVKDNQAPSITCKPGATKTISGSTYTISGTEFSATASDNCGTPSLVYCLSGATSVAYKSTNTSLAGVKLNVGTTTVTWQATDAGGNTSKCGTIVKVSKANAYSRSDNTGPDEKDGDVSEKPLQLMATIAPNPSSSYFTLQLVNGSNEKCTLIVFDMSGKLIERRDNVPAKGAVQLGSSYRPGAYIAEIIQGNNRVSIKLVKL